MTFLRNRASQRRRVCLVAAISIVPLAVLAVCHVGDLPDRHERAAATTPREAVGLGQSQGSPTADSIRETNKSRARNDDGRSASQLGGSPPSEQSIDLGGFFGCGEVCIVSSGGRRVGTYEVVDVVARTRLVGSQFAVSADLGWSDEGEQAIRWLIAAGASVVSLVLRNPKQEQLQFASTIVTLEHIEIRSLERAFLDLSSLAALPVLESLRIDSDCGDGTPPIQGLEVLRLRELFLGNPSVELVLHAQSLQRTLRSLTVWSDRSETYDVLGSVLAGLTLSNLTAVAAPRHPTAWLGAAATIDTLVLQQCAVTDLLPLSGCDLQNLTLAKCNALTYDSIRGVELPGLRNLRLVSCKGFGDDAIDVVTGWGSLERVWLSSMPFSYAALWQLLAHEPLEGIWLRDGGRDGLSVDEYVAMRQHPLVHDWFTGDVYVRWHRWHR